MSANFTSKRNPAYVNLVDENAASIGTSSNPIYTQATGGATQGVVPEKVTAAGAGDNVVSGSNSVVYAISTPDSVTLTLKDGSADIFSIVGPAQVSFYTPLGFTTSLTVNFSGAGSAYVQYQ